jgi:hypothetical protein
LSLPGRRIAVVVDFGRWIAPDVDDANVTGGGGVGDEDNDDMETSLLPPDESRPLENATLTTPRSYLLRRKLRGIIMWHFIEG